MGDSILQSAIEYAELGFDAIPLLPGAKRAYLANWQTRAPLEMWRDARAGSNIGLRCGGDSQFAAIDADDKDAPGTSANVLRFLAGLGFDAGDYPLIATPHGSGHHFGLALEAALLGNARALAPNIGAGELRYGRGAYVCAPPSIVDGRTYKVIAGDYRTLARVAVRDVLPMLKNQNIADTPPTDAPALATDVTPTVPRQAFELLQGNGIDRYASRSHAEAALVLMLVNAGFDFAAVLALFIAYPCAGKFKARDKQDPDKAIAQYLYPTFLSAQRKAEGRKIALSARQWAQARAWSGRTGAIDRAVYLAHCQLAAQSGRIEYGASSRTLAELAQVGFKTATRATHRLMDAGLLQMVNPNVKGEMQANAYKLTCCIVTPIPNPVGIVSSCNTHEAFWSTGLGKSAGLVFDELRRGHVLTVKELTARTGRARQTVWRALKRMARIVDPRTGEIVAMVTRAGDANAWQACAHVDLDYIAQLVGAHGKAERQREQHARERQDFRERIARYHHADRRAPGMSTEMGAGAFGK